MKKKWPKIVYLRHENPDGNDGYFLVEQELSPDFDGEVMGIYKLSEVVKLTAKTEYTTRKVKP